MPGASHDSGRSNVSSHTTQMRIAAVCRYWRRGPHACVRVHVCAGVCPCLQECSATCVPLANNRGEHHRPSREGLARGHGLWGHWHARTGRCPSPPAQHRATLPCFPWEDRAVAKAGWRLSGKPVAVLSWPCPGRLALFPGAMSAELMSTPQAFQLPLALSPPLHAAMEKVKMINLLSSLGEQVWGLQERQAGWLPSAPSHPAVCSWRLASSPYILQASRCCGQQWASESSGGEQGQRGDSPAPPLWARKCLRAQSGGKRPHPCCPGSSSPFLTPHRSSVRPLARAFCSCRGPAGGDPSLIPTELSLEPVVAVTLFCKGHYCLQFSLLCLNWHNSLN